MSDRAERLIALLPAAGADVLLVTDVTNVRYLTGFTGSSAVALIGPRSRTFITDFRYVEQSVQQVDSSFERITASRELVDAIEEALPDAELRLGFEAARVSVAQHARLRELLPDRVELVPVDGLVEGMRAVKDPGEVSRIREAATLADSAFGEVIGEGLVGRTERDLALDLEVKMRRLGASARGFRPVIAAGPHGALPHAVPRERAIRRGELVVIDWGAELDGYCSDCTRTLAAGEPGSRASEIYALVLEAQLAGLGAVRAGADAREVDATARAVIDAAGQAEHFGHGLGHGVGLEIHERPRLSQRTEDTLDAGNVITIEPGVYLPGQFGVRIEDLVLVTADGREVLTHVAKDLTVTE